MSVGDQQRPGPRLVEVGRPLECQSRGPGIARVLPALLDPWGGSGAEVRRPHPPGMVRERHRPYLRSGVYTLKEAVATLGSRALPQTSTALGWALHEWRGSLLARTAASRARGAGG